MEELLVDALELGLVEDRLIVNFAEVFSMTSIETLIPASV
jgi:hypothetical protein